MQQFQDDIMKNRILLEKIRKDLTGRIADLEKRVEVLEARLKSPK